VATCPQCGTELPEGAKFCPRDGTTISSQKIALSEEDPLLGRVIDGRYRVRARLGSGGVGVVYEGEHVEIKKPVAIKVLHGMFAATEEFRLRFEREARASSRLDHPSCVSVLDFGRVSRLEPMEGAVGLLGIPYLVMEFVRGRVLTDYRPSGAAEAVQIVLGILAGLRHAHSLGIVHRDVKPANVMVLASTGIGGEPLRTKLLDFGLAKDLGGPEAPEKPLTQAGTVFGTPSYLSPELAAGAKADARSDLYSAGVVLFELLCGRRPFRRDDPLDVVRDHLNTPPPSPRSLAPSLSPELESVTLKALAKKPEERWQSADELVAALAATPEGRGTSALAPAAPRPSPAAWLRPFLARARPRLRARWPLGAGLGAALLTLILMIAFRHRPPPPAPIVTAPPPVAALSESAAAHLSQARDYQRKLWCSDAVEELERALKADAAARHDPEAASVAIACLTPKTRDKATRFLVEKLGEESREPLREAAASDGNPEVRKGAERALERLAENRAPTE
jgi:eukaryotic-like serine/threonine-protein kinase